MTTIAPPASPPAPSARRMLNKVPEVTVYFWVIKILCTTVGESFADWINTNLGVGLENTALIFTAVLAASLAWQFRTVRYTPFVYWLTVVVLSVTGTLYTDILTDDLNVPLALSTAVFAALLAGVFAVWYRRERTLSIHSIVSFPREAYYWLAVLVTFALGTAAGDWTLELTGWGPGTSVLLPAGLIASIVVGWRFGAGPVLSFWLAYILTRPLGANLGDFFAQPTSDHGLGAGTAVTSVVFLAAILATVVYLTVSRSDVIETYELTHTPHVHTNRRRERIMVGYLALVAVVAAVIMTTAAASKPAGAPAGADAAEGASTAAAPTVALAPGQAVARFPKANVADYRTVARDTLAKVTAGDQAGAVVRIKALETDWDRDAARQQQLDATGWHYLDGRIDKVLKSVRAASPNAQTETHALQAVLTALG